MLFQLAVHSREERLASKASVVAITSHDGYTTERKHLPGAADHPRDGLLLVRVVDRGTMATDLLRDGTIPEG